MDRGARPQGGGRGIAKLRYPGATKHDGMSRGGSGLKRLNPWIGAAAFALAAVLIWRALHRYSLHAVLDSVAMVSLRHLALGALFTAASFVCLTGFDALAVRYSGRDLAYRKIALASFTALSIGHTLGFAAFSSGAVRYRLYAGWGLSAGDVGRIIVFSGVTVGLGLATLGGGVLLVRHEQIAGLFGADPRALMALGLALLAVVLTYLGLAAFRHRPLRIRYFELPVPPLSLALGQILLGTLDPLLVSAVLHQMLKASADIGFLPVAMCYVAANVAAIVSHVPGGLGVIEAVILSLVPGANVIGALVAFRAVYYLVPFVLGSLLFGASELVRRQRRALPDPG
jgi:glycosyltransferase 2 family protein